MSSLVGVVSLIAPATRAIRLDVHSMLDAMLLQATWNLAIEVLLMRADRAAAALEVPVRVPETAATSR